MSLKAITQVLEYAKWGRVTTGGLDARAKAEMTALKSACRTLAVNGLLGVLEERANDPERKAIAVLKAIAKEAE